MKNIRIGNDLNVAWAILKEGEPFNLEGLATKLYLKDMYGRKAVSGYTIQGNMVLWPFLGKDQKHTGKYSLELVINEGEPHMVTTDSCNFVNLVFCDCKGEPNEDIVISSELGFVAIIVDSELNEASENAVANKAVVQGLAQKADVVAMEQALALKADKMEMAANVAALMVEINMLKAAIAELAKLDINTNIVGYARVGYAMLG